MVAWDFHCFSSAKIASQEGHHYAYHYSAGRHLVLARILQMTHCRTAEQCASGVLPHGGARAAHGALPHGGGKFPGSEGGCGSPFEGPALRMARGRFVARPTRLPKSEEGVGVAKGTQSGTLFALPPGYVIYRTDDRIAPSVYGGL